MKVNTIPMTLDLLPLILLLFSWGCSTPPVKDSDYMILDDVEYVPDFPRKITLADRISTGIDVIGARNFAIIKDKMILNATDPSGFISVLSLPDHGHLGKFIQSGEGPLEFMQSPSAASQTKLTLENGQAMAYLYDFQKGRLMKFHVDQSLHVDSLVLAPIDESLPPYLTGITVLDSSTILCKELHNMDTQHRRYIHGAKAENVQEILEKLNKASVPPGGDFNSLASVIKYSTLNDKYVEMPIYLNYINIYARDGSFQKTICVGKKLDNVSEIERRARGLRVYNFSDVRIFEDFFGVVFINQTEMEYETVKRKMPSILLFDWEGNPLIEMKLEHHITAYDIDFTHNMLYTFDVHSDEFYRYNIGEILSDL